MIKKTIIILIFICLIIGGILVANNYFKKGDNSETNKNIIVNGLNDTNTLNNVEEGNVLDETNSILETAEIEKEKTAEKQKKESSNLKKEDPEEFAKEIVRNNWGEDDSIYLSFDGKDDKGNYIICVRDKNSTKALYWYYVNVEEESFDIK